MPEVDLTRRLQDVRARVTRERPTDEDWPVGPRYARLTRKDARLRDDQVAALTALVPVLMGKRRVKTERITINTLIRVGVDMLLAHRDELHGSSETELRTSVCPPHSETPEVPNSRSTELLEFGRPTVPASRTAVPGTAPAGR